jgi:UDP-N-acetyl-D-mannosaminuronic acid dehydrogenase
MGEWMSLADLRRKIEQRQAVIGVIGLGYVGLPVACMFAQVGFGVIGLDIKPERVATINTGRNPIAGEEPGLAELLMNVIRAGRLSATTDYRNIGQADVILIDVETPVDENHEPQYVALKSACLSLGAILKDGALVIVESTTAPGTVDRLVRSHLEGTSRKKANTDFYLGVCPERVMPGRLLVNLHTMSRVCGGGTPETAETMIALYQTIVQADLDPADCVTAELVKTAENAYRDVNIAFANELALACEATGGDFLRVRDLVNKSPGRNVLLAGAGVGGHCLPKDSWLLAHGVNGQAPLRLMSAARAVNDYMPQHVAHLIMQALREAGCQVADARVAVLGYAYLEDSDDTRNSPSKLLVQRLRELGADVAVHDPYVSEYRNDVLECVKGRDAAVVMVAHRAYKELDLATLKAVLRTPVLVDGRRVFDAVKAQAVGLIYRGVGQGRKSV